MLGKVLIEQWHSDTIASIGYVARSNAHLQAPAKGLRRRGFTIRATDESLILLPACPPKTNLIRKWRLATS
jgi:hypothetical protein